MDNNHFPAISVLIPFYNVKSYLNMAIDSVLAQSFTDFELILINDGSTDGSALIAEEYQKKDPRIKVYQIENSGVANARNLALSYATGDYIAFVDADDTIKPNYLECLYHDVINHNAEIAVCSYYRYVAEEGMYYFPQFEEEYDTKTFSGIEVYQNYYNPKNGYNIIFAVAWGKIIKRTLFRDIYFPNGKIHEDSFTIYKLYLLANKIVFHYKHLYMYRKHSESIVAQAWTRDKILAILEHQEERISLLSVMGIAITEDNKRDYMFNLRNCAQAALQNGFINEYKMVKQKLDLLENVAKKGL